MITSIHLHVKQHLSGGIVRDLGAFVDSYDSIESAKAAADYYLSTHDDRTVTICRVCDDVDDERYCEIVEDDL